MNEQFELMPFAAGQHMEQYMTLGRGRAGRASYRAGRLAPPVPSRPGWPRYPRSGRPYRTVMPYPEPYWYRQPVPVAVPFEPEPFPADWAAEPPMEESRPLPPGLRQAVNRVEGNRPQYRWRSTVASVLKKLPQEGYAGLYLLVFGPKGKERTYSGESGNLRRRLEEHRRFGRVLGHDISHFDVFIQHMPGSTREQRRALEKAFNVSGLGLNVLTNSQAEFAAGVPGAA